MKSHRINEFFGRYAAFLLRWRWVVIALFAVLGYDYFYAKAGMFTTYARNSEVWLKLKYSF